MPRYSPGKEAAFCAQELVTGKPGLKHELYLFMGLRQVVYHPLTSSALFFKLGAVGRR